MIERNSFLFHSKNPRLSFLTLIAFSKTEMVKKCEDSGEEKELDKFYRVSRTIQDR